MLVCMCESRERNLTFFVWGGRKCDTLWLGRCLGLVLEGRRKTSGFCSLFCSRMTQRSTKSMVKSRIFIAFRRKNIKHEKVQCLFHFNVFQSTKKLVLSNTKSFNIGTKWHLTTRIVTILGMMTTESYQLLAHLAVSIDLEFAFLCMFKNLLQFHTRRYLAFCIATLTGVR